MFFYKGGNFFVTIFFVCLLSFLITFSFFVTKKITFTLGLVSGRTVRFLRCAVGESCLSRIVPGCRGCLMPLAYSMSTSVSVPNFPLGIVRCAVVGFCPSRSGSAVVGGFCLSRSPSQCTNCFICAC